MKLQITLDDKLMNDMIEKSNASISEITGDALLLLYWAIGEISIGRKILSADSNNDNLRMVVLETLEKTKNTITLK